MIDRAAIAGMALGVGLLLILQETFSNSPSWPVLMIAGISVVIGAIVWSDLRENFTRHWVKVKPAKSSVVGLGSHNDHLHIATPRSDDGHYHR